MQRFDDPAQTIRVVVDEIFAVALAGNPTTGYTWQAGADARCLDLLSQEFEPGSEAIGAGGLEVFRFRAREVCRTEIEFEYRRPWEGVARDTARFRVVISS